MLFALALCIVVLFLFLLSLNWITHHGKILKIPSVIGKGLPEAKSTLEKQGFDIEIQDSVYVDSIPALAVVKQFPEADAEVKMNRTVYLTINRAAAPLVQMPQLVGQSFRSAEILLRQTGLKLGDTSFVPDFARNSVKKQLYNGKEITFGTKVPMGAKIDLVISNGISDEAMVVPNLIGMTYGDAKVLMESMQLEFGPRIFNPDVTDSANAYIFRQNPSHFNEDRGLNHIHMGQLVDIWLSKERPVVDTSALKPASTDPSANNY